MRFFFFLFVFNFSLSAQKLPDLWESSSVRKPLPYNFLREADVTWGKRVWRTIDLREKLNYPLRYPLIPNDKKTSLFDVLKKAVFQKNVSPMNYSKREFFSEINSDSLNQTLIRKKQKTVEDEFGKNNIIYFLDTIRAEEICQYFIIEDYFFDSKRSVLDSRIRAICPVWYNISEKQLEPVFWVEYDECRDILVNHSALNSKNDSRKISFDDLFNKRMYNSFITKESNIFDREVNEYAKGIDALYEAERIKQSIYNFESDLWEY
jgi:gliding motility associated protien GldN